MTEMVVGQRHESFLLRLSDALRPLDNPVAIQETATRETMAFFKADRCYYCELESGLAIIRRDAARDDLPSVAGTYPMSSFTLFDGVIQTGQPMTVEDVHHYPSIDEPLRQLCLELQVISFLNIPVVKREQVVGVLCLVQSQPRGWTALEAELVTETAERTWAAVEQAKAQEALRESEARYRALFASLDEGVCLLEQLPLRPDGLRDYRYLAMNPAMQTMFSVPDLSGQTVRTSFLHKAETWYDDYDRVLETGLSSRFERESKPQNKILEMFITRIEDGSEKRLLTVMRDVTLCRRAAAALRKSEERLQLLTEASSEMIFRMSPDWSQMYSMLGKHVLADTREPSTSWREGYIPDSETEVLQATIASAIENRSTFELEHRVIQADGTQGWTFSRAVPLMDEHGEILEWFGTASDITKRKQAEEALIQSEGRLRALIEHLPGGAVFVVNNELRYVLAEGEALVEAGIAPGDLVGRTVAQTIPPELVNEYEKNYRRVLAGQTFEYEHAAHERNFITRGVPLRNPAGDIYAALAVSYDITERKQAEEAVRQLNITLEERVQERTRRIADLNAELGLFIRRTARNLEAPARKLAELLDLARPGQGGLSPYDPAELQYELQRLTSVAQTIRQLSRLEQDELNLELIALGELIQQVRVSLQNQSASVHWTVKPLPIVRADRNLLWQAIEAALGFSLSPTRGATQVDISVQDDDGEVLLNIWDDGLGLSPEEASTLFDLTVRSEQAVPVLPGGGLSQVRRIMARHGGWAWAEAHLRGAKVILTLPHDPAVADLENMLL